MIIPELSSANVSHLNEDQEGEVDRAVDEVLERPYLIIRFIKIRTDFRTVN